MAIQNDGDIIRGLGNVALYCAYLEEAIDGVLTALDTVGIQLPPGNEKWPASRKISFCRGQISHLTKSTPDMAALDLVLVRSTEILDRRNDVIHGRLYGKTGRDDGVRKTGRLGVPDRNIDASELYELAVDADDASSALVLKTFAIHRDLSSR